MENIYTMRSLNLGVNHLLAEGVHGRASASIATQETHPMLPGSGTQPKGELSIPFCEGNGSGASLKDQKPPHSKSFSPEGSKVKSNRILQRKGGKNTGLAMGLSTHWKIFKKPYLGSARRRQ
jgi:hypothetical protein